MKLLTHNLLTSRCIKGVNVGYPLGIIVSLAVNSLSNATLIG